MDYQILPNGDLKFTLDSDEQAEWKEELADKEWIDFVEIFAETGLRGNCELDNIPAEAVGALTDSVIIADGVDYDPGGVIGAVGNVWWFPNYMVEDPAETLVNTGEVIFTAAPENKAA
jgi:hypothetical protein